MWLLRLPTGLLTAPASVNSAPRSVFESPEARRFAQLCTTMFVQPAHLAWCLQRPAVPDGPRRVMNASLVNSSRLSMISNDRRLAAASGACSGHFTFSRRRFSIASPVAFIPTFLPSSAACLTSYSRALCRPHSLCCSRVCTGPVEEPGPPRTLPVPLNIAPTWVEATCGCCGGRGCPRLNAINNFQTTGGRTNGGFDFVDAC